MTEMRLFDSHCHINSKEFDEDREEVIARMKESGLTAVSYTHLDVYKRQHRIRAPR